MKEIIQLINFNILTKLISSRKASPVVSFEIFINDELYEYFKEIYGINRRFKENDLFLSDNKLENHRCVNQKYFTKAQGFQFKLQKSRQLKYNQFISTELKGEFVQKIINSQPMLSIRFIRYSSSN